MRHAKRHGRRVLEVYSAAAHLPHLAGRLPHVHEDTPGGQAPDGPHTAARSAGGVLRVTVSECKGGVLRVRSGCQGGSVTRTLYSG